MSPSPSSRRAGAAYFILGGGGSSSSTSAPAAAPPTGAVPSTSAAATTAPPASAPPPQGVVDRAVAEAERQLSNMGTDLKHELQAEWEAANTEPPPEGTTPEAQAAAAQANAAVLDALKAAFPSMRSCFDEARQAGAVTPLEVTLTVKVAPTGIVATQTVYLDSSTEPEGMTSCLTTAVNALNLASIAPRGSTTTVTLPLRF